MRSLILAVLTILLTAATQQSPVLRGRVVDAEGRPFSGATVLLHRVSAEGGASVVHAVSDAEGDFELRAPDGFDPDATYFAATRVDGRLYLGAPFQGGGPPERYTIVLDDAHSADAMVAATPPAGASTPSAWPFIALIGAALAAWAVWAWRTGPRRREMRRRERLLDLALQERAGAAPTKTGG